MPTPKFIVFRAPLQVAAQFALPNLWKLASLSIVTVLSTSLPVVATYSTSLPVVTTLSKEVKVLGQNT